MRYSDAHTSPFSRPRFSFSADSTSTELLEQMATDAATRSILLMRNNQQLPPPRAVFGRSTVHTSFTQFPDPLNFSGRRNEKGKDWPRFDRNELMHCTDESTRTLAVESRSWPSCREQDSRCRAPRQQDHRTDDRRRQISDIFG